ncbi:MAG: arylsulfatase [Planctomycetota bacterium]
MTILDRRVPWLLVGALPLPLAAQAEPLQHHLRLGDAPPGALAFADPASWTRRDGVLVRTEGQGAYTPPVRSPRGIALLDGIEVGDFELRLRVRQTGREYAHRDLCFFFGFQDPSRFYYAHLATRADEHAHGVFLVDRAPRRKLADGGGSDGVAWGDGWHDVRIERSLADGRIAVWFDDAPEPLFELRDKTLGFGRLGFGSFDDTGAFESLALEAPRWRRPTRPAWVPAPNLIYILADDLGYGELGSYGQEKIETPHLDRLAREGMRFTQHYAGAPVCAPSRCVLLTGQHTGHATIRDNLEHRPEGQGPIRDEDVTLAERLGACGYVNGCFGKWGLGYPGSEGDPQRQGFDRFYGYNCQRHAHNFYPRYLWDDGERVDLEGNDRGRTGAQYSHDLIAAQALSFIREHSAERFFCYVPFTIPHLALQVPQASLERYLGRWPETPYEGKSYLPHPTPRAAYAAMISHLDASVGEILGLLDELGLAENTLVVFASDNGPTHLKAQADVDFFASAGPLRGLKGSVYEGGIRVPMLVRWPGRVAPGSVSDLVCGFQDILPTFVALAGGGAVPGIDGLSLLPTLLGDGEQEQHEALVWDFPGYGGQLAVRAGRWKAVRRGLRQAPAAPLELYDLDADVGETRDVAAEHPEVAARLATLMVASRTEPAVERFRFGSYGR